MSSSTIIEVAVMKTSAAAYRINLTGVELALACQWVENEIYGAIITGGGAGGTVAILGHKKMPLKLLNVY